MYSNVEMIDSIGDGVDDDKYYQMTAAGYYYAVAKADDAPEAAVLSNELVIEVFGTNELLVMFLSFMVLNHKRNNHCCPICDGSCMTLPRRYSFDVGL